jgi:hypothetical protein
MNGKCSIITRLLLLPVKAPGYALSQGIVNGSEHANAKVSFWASISHHGMHTGVQGADDYILSV